MLTEKDIQKISEILNYVQNLIEKKKVERKLRTLVGKIKEINTLIAEDSGYIIGYLGSFSYVFIRSVAIDNKGNKEILSKFYLFPYSFYEGKKIEDYAEIIARTLEYVSTLELAKKTNPEIILMDGSLVSDLIHAVMFLSLFRKGDLKVTYEELYKEYENYLDIEEIDFSFLEDIPKIFTIFFIKSIKDLLNFVKEKEIPIIYVIKRPIDSKKLVSKYFSYLSGKINDYLLLNLLFKNTSFITDLFKSELETQSIRQIFIDTLENYLFSYYRKVPNGHIFRSEIPDFYPLEEIRDIVYTLVNNLSDVKGFPYLLLLSHKLSNVRLSDKKLIERLIISKLKEFVIP